LATASLVPAPEASTIELSIMMPCLNEAETLERCIVKAKRFLAEHQVSGEIIVADNGSTDGSDAIARRCGARVVKVPVKGYGAALYYGTLAALGRYVIMGDSDDSYDFQSLAPFLTELRNGRDLVMGNRFMGGIRPGAMPWKNRYIGNPVLTWIGRLFFACPVRDFHCGLRGFNRASFEEMDLKTTGMEFASEMVIKATLLQMEIAEVPTTLDKDGRSRPPHLRPWRDGWRHLRFMLLYSPRWLFLYPGLALMLLGLIVGGALLRGPINLTPSFGFDIHTLLFAGAAVTLGFQGVTFAFMARVFALNQGLLPGDDGWKGLSRAFTLELGLILGLLLVLTGAGTAIAAVVGWSHAGFGVLSPQRMMRAVIPAVTALSLGCEVILASFFVSVLGLQKRR
jgi:glycosyltransferase involved in cell wall biosynthesis